MSGCSCFSVFLWTWQFKLHQHRIEIQTYFKVILIEGEDNKIHLIDNFGNRVSNQEFCHVKWSERLCIQLSCVSLYLTDFLFTVSNRIQIVSTEPRDGTIAKKGEDVRLSCKTNPQWFFCVWKGPGEIKQVLFHVYKWIQQTRF